MLQSVIILVSIEGGCGCECGGEVAIGMAVGMAVGMMHMAVRRQKLRKVKGGGQRRRASELSTDPLLMNTSFG